MSAPRSGGVRGVVFDLDGTLVDTWAVHADCLREAAEAVGRPRPGTARLFAVQRPTDLGTVSALVGAEFADEAFGRYQRAWRRKMADEGVRASPGAHRTVLALRQRGLAVGVCTGRSLDGARAALAAAALTPDVVVAREDAGPAKPAPDGLLRALHLLRLAADEAIYVGDGPADVEQGRAAGVRTLLLGRSRPRDLLDTPERVADLWGLVAVLAKGDL